MNLTLEKKILGYMLNNVDEAKRTPLEPYWFGDKSHRELATVLMNSEKEFTDFSQLEYELKSIYPKSSINEEWMHLIKFEEMFIDDLKASVKALEKEYIQDKTNQATMTYLENPTAENKEKLEDWLRRLDQVDVEEDTGELDDTIAEILDEFEHGVKGGLKSYPRLNKILGNGLEGGMMFILAGRPGTGKTAYAINLAIEMLYKQPDVQVDFFTLEMTKIAMAKRFISRLTGINSYKFKDTKRLLKDDEKREVIEKMDWLNKTGLRIHDSKFKLSEIERTIRQRRHEHKEGKYIAFVDYVGLVNVGGSLDRYLEVGKISRTLKLLTNELNIPIVVLSQLNRGVEARQDKKPVLSDLRESGDLEQDANVVGLLSEDQEMDHVINLDIAKNREGMLATIPYEFYKPATTFREIDVNG